MSHGLRARFWLESLLAAVSAVLAVFTAVWPTWIEGLFEVEPDAGSGALEWAIVAAFACAAVVLAVLARIEFRRPSPAQ